MLPAPHIRRPSAAWGWLLVILFFPVLGALVFLVLGRADPPEDRQRKQRGMTRRVDQEDPAVVASWDARLPPYVRHAVGLDCANGGLLLVGGTGFPGHRQFVRRTDAVGIPWHRMLPVRPWRGEYQRPDLRNHRKIVVGDGHTAFTGSQNVIDRSCNKRANRRRGLRTDMLLKEGIRIFLDTEPYVLHSGFTLVDDATRLTSALQ